MDKIHLADSSRIPFVYTNVHLAVAIDTGNYSIQDHQCQQFGGYHFKILQITDESSHNTVTNLPAFRKITSKFKPLLIKLNGILGLVPTKKSYMKPSQRSLTVNIQNISSFLTNNNFSLVKDNLGEYSKKSVLYYKQISNDEFIVINHFNSTLKQELQGFDMWKSRYNKPSEIGSKWAKSITRIKLSIHLPGDVDLVKTALHR